MIGFDALWTATAKALTGGLDERMVARSLAGNPFPMLALARALDEGVENLVVMIGLTADRKLVPFFGQRAVVRREMDAVQPVRVATADMNVVADAVRRNAEARGIDIGDRFTPDPEELAHLVSLRDSEYFAQQAREFLARQPGKAH